MAYILTLSGKEHRVEVEELGVGHYRVTLDDERTFDVDARRTNGSIYSFIVEHQVFEADFEDSNGELAFLLDGEMFHVHAIDERRKRLRAAAAGSNSGGKIVTPMPGKVVRILAPVGTEVKAGDGVVVLEAMKMENEMTAPVDGVVSEIPVAEGQAVDGNTVLAKIDGEGS